MISSVEPSMKQNNSNARLLHTMVRVADLNRSIAFYVDELGMIVKRRADYPAGRYTLVFLAFDGDTTGAEIELTHNWDISDYDLGSGFGHIAIGVTDVATHVSGLAARGVPVIRKPGARIDEPSEVIAFVEDPDGYRIEFVQVAPI